MGNNLSNQKWGFLRIQLDQEQVYAGQSISGTVFVTAYKRTQPFDLLLNIVGQESGKYPEQAKRNT